MSISAFQWAKAQHLSPTCKLVLVMLADRANADGECWPSVATLMVETGLSDRSVQRSIADLEACGAIERRDRRGTSTVYRCTMKAIEPPTQCHPRQTVTTDTVSPPPPTVCHPTPDTVSPKPLLNPQEEERKKESLKTYTLPLAARVTGKPVVCDDGFDGFWHLYPRKVGKGAARKAWAAAIGKTSVAEIMAGLARWQPPPDSKFTPHPATWLNAERWADEEEDNSLDARMNRILRPGNASRTIDAEEPRSPPSLRLV